MKKKISGFFLGIFMFVFSLFSLSACSLVSVDRTKVNSQSVLKVGNTVLTRGDIIDSFYSYYQNNGAYFSYYDNKTIEDSFYLWTIMRQIVRDRADELFESGELQYTAKDDQEVWDSVKEYFYNNVNSYEKADYKYNEYLEENYPIWLRTDEEDDSDTIFEPYTRPELEFRQSGENFSKLSDDEVKSKKVKEIEKYIFEYSLGKDEDGNDNRREITAETYQTGNLLEDSRNKAFTKYKMNLVTSAKANGTSTDPKVVFENEVIRVYNSYYENKLTSILQQYYTNNYIMNLDLSKPLGDESVVEKFLSAYYSDLQNYQGESKYISKITDSNGASLVLYNYNGQNFFFTVQHILVSYDDYMTERIKELYGYDLSTGSSKKDFSMEVYSQYKEERDKLTNGYNMLSKVNEDNFEELSSLISEEDAAKYFDYYYIDSSVKDDAGSRYIKLNRTDTEGVVTYTDNSGNEYDEGDVVKMSNEEQILKMFKDKFVEFTKSDGLFATYYNNSVNWAKDKSTESADYTAMETARAEHKDFEYIFDTLDSIAESSGEEGYALAKQKIASFLFVEMEWLFSGDSLKNELSNKMGYVMSNYPDENGSWVVEFAEGAREIISNLMDSATTTSGQNVQTAIQDLFSGDSPDLGKLTTTIISNYGYHIIKVEDIFVQGSSIINFEPQERGSDGKYSEEFIAKIVNQLKQTYVCSASNQTLYDYYYDELFNELIGTNGSGDYFVNQQYSWYNKYISDNQVTYISKLSYGELLDEIR